MPDDDSEKPTTDKRIATEHRPRMTGQSLGVSPSFERMKLADRMGEQFGGDRNLYEAVGYKSQDELTIEAYFSKYLRNPLARAIVDRPPQETWSELPEVQDNDSPPEDSTDFEDDVETLLSNSDHRLHQYLKRADVLNRIGHFAVLVFGFSDGKPLSEPIEPDALDGPDGIEFIQPVGEDRVEDIEIVTDDTDERYQEPERYEIDFGAKGPWSEATPSGIGDDDDVKEVHWTRTVHVSGENALDSDLVDRPAMEPVFNRLEDAEKVVAASSEAMWKLGNPGYALIADPEAAGEMTDDELEGVEDEAQAWYHGFQPFMRLSGMKPKKLDGEDTDPTGIFDQILKSVSGQIGIPKRILTGSESAELASSQDRSNWLSNIGERQRSHAEPNLFRPAIARFTRVGAVAQPRGDGFELTWPNLFELTEVEEAQVALDASKAIKNVRGMSGREVVTPGEFRDRYLHMDPTPGSEIDDGDPTAGRPGAVPSPDDQPDLPPDQENPPDPADVDEDDPEVADQFDDPELDELLADARAPNTIADGGVADDGVTNRLAAALERAARRLRGNR